MREVETGKLETISCDLAGEYQMENLATALTVIRELERLGWNLPSHSVMEGMASVAGNTGILGRWQTVGSNPRSVCDTAHNHAGIEAVMHQVRQIPWKELHLVWGMAGDKETGSILPLLPREAKYYFTRSTVPRSMDENRLRQLAHSHGLEGKAFPTVESAYRSAQQNADESDMIFTGGSTFVVADLLRFLGYQ
jgi:dihydrofolate synthase/folylpolyglutamate synthase